MREGRSHAATAPISVGVLRAVVRRWPVVVLITFGAVLAGCLALAMRDESYQATANLLVVPLAQHDETFLGTSLIRDSGDASRTPGTVARAIETRDIGREAAREFGAGWTTDEVLGAITVRADPASAVLDVTAQAPDPETAERLAATFARAALHVRGRNIAAKVDDRIAGLGDQPDEGEVRRDVALLTALRRAGGDPTLELRGTHSAASVSTLPAPVVLFLALCGGLFLGTLAALGLDSVGRQRQTEDDGALADTPSRAESDALSLHQ